MAKKRYELKQQTLDVLHALIAVLIGETDRLGESVFSMSEEVIEDIVPDGHPKERDALRALLAIHNENKTVGGSHNPILPTKERIGQMVGDIGWVDALMSKRPEDNNVAAASLVYKHVFELERIRIAQEKNAILLADTGGLSTADVLRQMEQNLAQANPNRVREQSLDEVEVYEAFSNKQDEYHQRILKHGISVLPFPWPTFQANMGGVPEGEPVIISTDDTGMGKTMLALDWEMFIVQNFPYLVVHLTHETYAESIATRLMRWKYLLPQYSFKGMPFYQGYFYPIVNPKHPFWKPLFDAHSLEVEARMANPQYGTLQVRAVLEPTVDSILDAIVEAHSTALRLKKQLMIVDDYIQLWDTSMIGGQRSDLRDEQQRGIAARRVRALAKSFNASLIVLSQTSKDGKKVYTQGARSVQQVFQAHVNLSVVARDEENPPPNEEARYHYAEGYSEPVFDFFGNQRYMNSDEYSGLGAKLKLAKANEGGKGMIQHLAIEYPMGRVYPADKNKLYEPYTLGDYHMAWLLTQHDETDLNRWRVPQ